MNSGLKTRLALPEDTSAIVEFNKAMAWETEKKILDETVLTAGVQTVIDGKAEAFYLVAVDSNNEVLGSLMITREWSDWRNAFIWWIQSVYVLPQHRKQGVFKMLFNRINELAKEKNCCGLRLYVEEKNQTAQNTYSSLGMKKSYYLIYEDMADAK